MRFAKRRQAHTGAPPGTLVHVGSRRVERARVRVVSYGPDFVEEREVADPADCIANARGVTWVAVSGLHEVDAVRTVGECFGLHPLVLEDVLDTGQRPKVEIFEDYIVCIARSFEPDEDGATPQQVSLVLKPPFVLSFEESAGSLFNPIRGRIESGLGRIRASGPDYLLYALLDSVVDSWFTSLDHIAEQTEELEQAVVSEPSGETLRLLRHLRTEVADIRRAAGPMREAAGLLWRGELEFINPDLELYLRDVYDHVIHVEELTEDLRDILMGMLDIYLSGISNRMNEIMKVLTMIATIFIPATFVAGVYGMNFDYMPELRQPWGYPVALGIMLAIGVGMLLYFRRKGWIWSG